MWRYILAGFTGAVAGVAILVGVLLVVVPEEEAVSSGSQNAMLCADALTRRQNADMVIANPPGKTYYEREKALKEAGVQRTTAHADVGRFCGG